MISYDSRNLWDQSGSSVNDAWETDHKRGWRKKDENDDDEDKNDFDDDYDLDVNFYDEDDDSDGWW